MPAGGFSPLQWPEAGEGRLWSALTLSHPFFSFRPILCILERPERVTRDRIRCGGCLGNWLGRRVGGCRVTAWARLGAAAPRPTRFAPFLCLWSISYPNFPPSLFCTLPRPPAFGLSGMRRSPDVSPRRLSDISPQLRQLKYLVVDEAIKEDLKWSRSVEDLTSGPAGLTSIEDRILRITGYYGYQPWAASYKSKTLCSPTLSCPALKFHVHCFAFHSYLCPSHLRSCPC